MHPNHLPSSPILSTPPLPRHTQLKYRGLGPGICDDVGEDGVESFAETGWVSSDSGKKDTESRRLCQQLRESAGLLFLHPGDMPPQPHKSASGHTRDPNL